MSNKKLIEILITFAFVAVARAVVLLLCVLPAHNISHKISIKHLYQIFTIDFGQSASPPFFVVLFIKIGYFKCRRQSIFLSRSTLQSQPPSEREKTTHLYCLVSMSLCEINFIPSPFTISGFKRHFFASLLFVR